MNGEVVRRIAAENAWESELLPSAPVNGIFVAPTPRIHFADNPTHPPYMIFRSNDVLSIETCALLASNWLALKAAGLKLSPADTNRSKSAGVHIDVWDHYDGLRATADSVNQTSKVVSAMDVLLSSMKDRVVPVLDHLLSYYAPTTRRHQHQSDFSSSALSPSYLMT
jgi:hypothetical protein